MLLLDLVWANTAKLRRNRKRFKKLFLISACFIHEIVSLLDKKRIHCLGDMRDGSKARSRIWVTPVKPRLGLILETATQIPAAQNDAVFLIIVQIFTFFDRVSLAFDHAFARQQVRTGVTLSPK